MEFKVGDKVKVLSKSYGNSSHNSQVYRKSKKQGYAFVIRIEHSRVEVNDKLDSIHGGYFLEKDLELYDNKMSFDY